MNIINTLNEKLLNQVFNEGHDKVVGLAHYQYMAFMYAEIENSIAVLSDMKTNKSYIYHGGVAKELGLSVQNNSSEINTIWEEVIFSKIHPDDLLDKHLLELQFFNMIKNMPIKDRANYHVSSRIRILNKDDEYTFIKHRMFYVSSLPNGSLWLALCLYNLLDEEFTINKPHRLIVNSATGEILKPDNQKSSNILSLREKEILQLIRKGKMSKEIADAFQISINTVNRHRQNILEKLRVNNSHEACRIAEIMQLI
ncbi:response regulator transcription factor [Pedobacter sandarakinus]|uniref:response regulator transcription factor n=1 Tax=Pedobacter sandarakinus TaxID=353156 RepID=UPI00224762E4|nr:LuxR C-terminal-related transcriptional regulator [Pedobacter sandarakinus]MCX2575788.1 LuxR C-terminal-related transcriptional regulator [Pedobacter sandarakinus]